MTKPSRGTTTGRRIFLKIFFLLIAALITGGGCGGGGGGDSSAARGLELLSVAIPDTQTDAEGYLNVTASIRNSRSSEAEGLMLVLFATKEGDSEQVIATGQVHTLTVGDMDYDCNLKVDTYDRDLNPLSTGKYGNVRFELIDTGSGERVLVDEYTSSAVLSYTAAGELPVIVRNSLMIDVKESPQFGGYDGMATLSALDETGWRRMEAGHMHGEPVVVAYMAEIDVRMELAATTREIAGFEIVENGGALLIRKAGGEPVKTMFWEGPFQDGEVGLTFTAMYWGTDTPPDIGTLSFTVVPIPVDGTSARSSGTDRFAAQVVADETLALARSRMDRSARSAVAATRMPYRDFASMVWNLWLNYDVKPTQQTGESLWDTRPEPAIWYARLFKDLTAIVRWEEAAEIAPALASLSVKRDFFAGDRPINFDNPEMKTTYFIRVPLQYRTHEDAYNELYNASSTFPYGNESYFKWWSALPSWMIREALFPRPARAYGTLVLGDMRDDDYLWQVAYPRFEAIVSTFGSDSHEYDMFWTFELGVPSSDPDAPAPKRTKDEYRALFPQGNEVTLLMLEYLEGKGIASVNAHQPIKFEYGKDGGTGEYYNRYRNDIEYQNSLGSNSKFASVGYRFFYDDGIELRTDGTGTDAGSAKVAANYWTILEAGTPATILGVDVSPFFAHASFSGGVRSRLTHNLSGGAESFTWGDIRGEGAVAGEKTEACVKITQKMLTFTIFDETVDFFLQPDEKDNITQHDGIHFPLVSKAFTVPIADPDKMYFEIAGVTIKYAFGLEGSVGVDFIYRHGLLRSASGSGGGTNYPNKPVGVMITLEPMAELSSYITASVEVPLVTPLPPLYFELSGKLTLIRLNLPLSVQRNIALAARKLQFDFDQEREDASGTWYYSMNSNKKYTLTMGLGGLDGTIDFKVSGPFTYPIEKNICTWDGLEYPDLFEIINSNYPMPLAIAVLDPSKAVNP